MPIEVWDQSPIALVRHAVRLWCLREGGSREAVAGRIVAVHESLGLDRVDGVRFDPPADDEVERLRLNTIRIFRWLDDDSKDDDLLPLNCLPAVLAALPLDLRMQLTDALLLAAGLRVVLLSRGDGVLCLGRLLHRVVKENADTAAALARAVGEPGELRAALGALHRNVATLQDAVTAIEACDGAIRQTPRTPQL